jgi:hypothetical protein
VSDLCPVFSVFRSIAASGRMNANKHTLTRYDNIGYEAVFIIPAILLAIDLLMRFIMIEKPGG